MFSKKNISILTSTSILSLAAVLLIGCGIKVGEQPKNVEEPAKVKSAQCLNQSIDELALFIKGEASDQQVDRSVQCLANVFVAFKDNIRGERKNVYTPQEIAHFVEDNIFTDGTRIPEVLLTEIMNFKVALIGGSDNLILKSEIDAVVDLLARLKPNIVRLNPHMKIIAMKWQIQLSAQEAQNQEKQFLAAKKEFSSFVGKFLAEFKAGDRPYKIDNLINFAVEGARFFKSEETTIDKIQKARDFLKQFKTHLIGGDLSLRGNDWEKLGLTLTEAYFQTLRFHYFVEPLHKEQIEQKWVVYQSIALDLSGLVETLLDAKDTQSLTNDELLDIIQPLADILPEIQINKELLENLGDIKVMILGSSDLGRNGWSRADFTALNKKIPTLFKNLSILFASSDTLAMRNAGHVVYADFQANETKILAAVAELTGLIESSYDLKSLEGLLNNLSKTLLKDSMRLPEDVESFFKLAYSVQTVLTGETGTVSSASNVKLLFNVGMRSYLNYAEFTLFLSHYEFKDVRFVDNLMRLLPKVNQTLIVELTGKKSHLITTDELTSLVLTLQEQKLLGTEFRADSLRSAINALWTNIFNDPNERLSSNLQPGFNAVVLKQISQEVVIYLKNQKNISEIFMNKDEVSQSDLVTEFKSRLSQTRDPFIGIGISELLQFLTQSVPLNFDDQGFLKILTLDVGTYHFNDLSQSNLSRTIARLLIRGYANEKVRVNTLDGVKLDEAETAFSHFRGIAVDIKAIEPENLTFMSSRFLEANLFLAPSNGDNLASLPELHQIILHIFSGVSRAEVLKAKIAKACLTTPVSEINSHTGVNEDCLLDVYLKESEAFNGLPLFMKMHETYDAVALKEYYMSLLKAAGHIPNDQKLAYFTDVDLFPHVAQYIEMLFAARDLNHDGLLQKDEAFAAFPVFKGLLKELVVSFKQIKEDDLQGVFIYILKFGRPPKKESLAEVLKFVSFIRDKDQKGWDIQSTRVDLGKIFNFIADSTKPVVPTPVVPAPTPAPAPTP